MGKAMRRANGTGTVYKLAGRRRRPWVAAKQKIIIGYYPTKKDAIAALERLAGKDLTERYNMTFAQVFDAWKEEHYKKIGPNGIEGYDGAFKIFAPLHDRKFRDLKTADFQGVLDAHMHKSHSTVSKYKQLITQMSTWAMREEIITTNFAKFVQLPENTKKEKENVVDKLFSDDLKSFLKIVCDNDDIDCFDEAVEYYDELKRKTDKIIKAEFDYVTMPKDEQLERIKQYLMKQYQADKVELTLKEEKDLIGGFVLKVGDHVYDNSLSGKMRKLQQKLTWR